MLKYVGHLKPEDVRAHHAAAIASELANCPAASKYGYYGTLGRWLRAIGASPACLGLPQVVRPGPRERVVSAVEIEATMRVAYPPAQLAMLLANEAGLRAGAIARLCRHHCDFKRKMLRGPTKGGANYSVPMTTRVYEALLWAASRAEPEQPLVDALAHYGGRMNVLMLDYHVRHAKARAGVTSQWTLHDLRRTAARRVYERTHDVRKVQRVLTHRHLSTTMWYLGDAGVDVTTEELEPKPTTKREEKTA